MFYLSMPNNGRWEIKRDGKIVLFGIGTAQTAALIAKQYGIILSKYSEVA